MPKDNLRIRIDVAPMPTIWCTDTAALSLGLQSGRDQIVRGEKTNESVRFEVEIGVKRGRDGSPDFTGPLVHGRPGERFLYLSWGHVTPEQEHDMFRRLKLYLTPVSRSGWSSSGISWQQVERGSSVAAAVSGRGPDGTPQCGTAPVHWESFDG